MTKGVLIRSPKPVFAVEPRKLAPPVPDLVGRHIGFRIEWANYEIFVEQLERKLAGAGEIASTRHWEWMQDKRILERSSPEAQAQRRLELAEFTEGLDVAIVGLAA